LLLIASGSFGYIISLYEWPTSRARPVQVSSSPWVIFLLVNSSFRAGTFLDMARPFSVCTPISCPSASLRMGEIQFGMVMLINCAWA